MWGGLGGGDKRWGGWGQQQNARPQGMGDAGRPGPGVAPGSGVQGAPAPVAPRIPAAPVTPPSGVMPMNNAGGGAAATGSSSAAPSGGSTFVGRMVKGGTVKSCSYAEGGAVLGRSRSFTKGDDEFRTGKGVPQNYIKGAKGDVDKTPADKSDGPALKSLR
jgi:hypothetical protein